MRTWEQIAQDALALADALEQENEQLRKILADLPAKLKAAVAPREEK